MKKVILIVLMTVVFACLTVSCTKDDFGSENEIDVYSPDKDKIDPPGGNG